jgi:hypothetical protein
MIYGSLWVAVGFVLLIACAHKPNAGPDDRPVSRIRHKAGTRRGPWRMLRQILSETLMPAVAGGVPEAQVSFEGAGCRADGLSIVLLSGAGILVRSFWKLVSADVGVSSPERVLIGRISVPCEKYASARSHNAFFDSLRSRLPSVSGIESVALANVAP